MGIAIWGAGAVGIGLASALARPEVDLRLIGRNRETLEALATRGIEREGIMGERSIAPEWLRLESRTETLAEEPPESLLICTKAYSTAKVAETLEPLSPSMKQTTRIILCQNGWGNETPFLPFWPRERIFHARVITGFHRHGLHRVEITAHAAPVAMGSLFGEPTDSLEDVASRLSAGGIPSEVRDDMERVLWAKMLYNCALNPLGALTNRRYGELAAAATTRETMRRVVEEIFAVLAKSGHAVEWPDAESYLETFYTTLIPPTAAHESSMLQDLRAGRTTEIEALCGAVEQLAAAHRVATPIVSALATLVRAAERGAGKVRD